MQLEITVESLSADRAVDRLAREGIRVYAARRPRKNAVVLRIDAKDREKVFAIFKGTCYNVCEVASVGVKRRLDGLVRSIGLAVGFVLFFAGILFAEGRVLGLEVVGSGAYYEREVREILARGGVRKFSPQPRDIAPLTAEILSLPRVEFCAFHRRGGTLTVEVNVSDDSAPLARVPLLSPATGVVDELVVVRGTPRVAEGEEVTEGQELVSCESAAGENVLPVLVIARVTVAYPVSREYEGEEAAARAQATLDFGVFREIHMSKTERGWLVEGIALKTASVNLA